MRNADPLLSLCYAVRPRVLLAHLGLLCRVMALLNAVPVVVGVALGEGRQALAYLVPVLSLALASLLLRRVAVGQNHLQHNEGVVLMMFTYLVTPLLLIYPFCAAGLAPLDAWFEAISALTTTGLSTAGTLAGRPETFLFARAWVQWYGGLGIVVFTLALLIAPGLAAKRLSDPGFEQADLLGSSRAHGRRVVGVYVGLSVLGWLLIWPELGAWRALLYLLGAISTGGFAPDDASLEPLPWLTQSTLMLVALCGALPLPLWYRTLRRDARGCLWCDTEVRALGRSLLLFGLIFTLLLVWQQGLDWGTALREGPLLLISAHSGTGFTTRALDALLPGLQWLLILAMLVGGTVGSTAGGYKVWRMLILLRLARLMLLRSALTAHAVAEPELSGRRLEAPEVQQALMVVVLLSLVVVLSWFGFLLAGVEPMAALFEVVSATATVGLSSGLSGPALAPPLKLLLGLDMLLGRVEVIALLVLLWSRTWWGPGSGTGRS